MSDTFICHKTGLEFKRIPAPRGNRHRLLEPIDPHTNTSAEKTEGDVYPFWLATTPICGKHVHGIKFESGPPPVLVQGDDFPVVNISFNDVQDTLLKTEGFKPYRLPTEFEWEWAALGGENFKYAGSPNHLKVAWTKRFYGGNCNALQPVKLKSPNGYGLYDMSGNILEWTSTEEGPLRVFRGGSWLDAPANARVALRDWFAPVIRYDSLGVRLCFSE